MVNEIDREWTQEELRQLCRDAGWTEEQIGVDPIPQGIKYVFPIRKPTEADIARGLEVARELGLLGEANGETKVP